MTFDHIITREDKDLRGRQPLEVANLLHHGALTGSILNEHIEIIPDEQEALKKAIKDARSGDIISIFYKKIEPLIKIIKEHKTHIYN